MHYYWTSSSNVFRHIMHDSLEEVCLSDVSFDKGYISLVRDNLYVWNYVCSEPL